MPSIRLYFYRHQLAGWVADSLPVLLDVILNGCILNSVMCPEEKQFWVRSVCRRKKRSQHVTGCYGTFVLRDLLLFEATQCALELVFHLPC